MSGYKTDAWRTTARRYGGLGDMQHLHIKKSAQELLENLHCLDYLPGMAKTVTYDEIRHMKAVDRKRDWDRLARGEVTPMQLQEENSIFSLEAFRKAKIVDFPAAIKRIARNLRMHKR